ncbi:MAG: hypothetical protein LBJ12_09370 [Oscillospiraceae bacterium]|jgi:hypothetical protein|nr:hypothetical protein [Oscillospiraceae bacterium]
MKENRRIPFKKLFWCVFIIALPLFTALRFHHLNKLLEPVDGFYASRDWSVVTLSVLVVLVVVFFIGLNYFTRGSARLAVLRYDGKPIKSRATAIAAIALSLCLLWDMFVCVNFLREHLGDNLTAVIESDNTFTILMKTGLLPRLLEAIMAFPVAVFVLLFGIEHFHGKGGASNRHIWALFPALWLVMRTIFRFTRTLSFMRVSELFYELLALAFLLIFFMTFAQLYSGVNESNNDWILPAFGFPAALFALLCFVPRILMILIGREDQLTKLAPADPVDLTLALFVLSVLRVRLRASRQTQGE